MSLSIVFVKFAEECAKKAMFLGHFQTLIQNFGPILLIFNTKLLRKVVNTLGEFGGSPLRIFSVSVLEADRQTDIAKSTQNFIPIQNIYTLLGLRIYFLVLHTE